MQRNLDSRVVITGIGMWTDLGLNCIDSWSALTSGTRNHVWTIAPCIAGAPRQARMLAAVHREALADARLSEHEPFDRTRVGVVLGSSKGDLAQLAAAHRGAWAGVDDWGASWAASWPNQGAAQVAAAGGWGGPCLAPVAACATGLIAALQGADLIHRGVCDVVLAGAADCSREPIVLGALRRMGVLARVREGGDPAAALRPWDRERSGFLVGEGAALLVLERSDHALARGVAPYCELAGGASGGDAYHLTDLNPDPSTLSDLIKRALKWSNVDPSEIDHINVHGTATRANDPLECRALRQALGPHAEVASCSANKAQIGHCLGAAGAVELAFTALAVRDGFVPPTLNLDTPDPACDLDGTPHVGRARTIRAALKLSIGFGGHLAAAVLRRHEGARR